MFLSNLVFLLASTLFAASGVVSDADSLTTTKVSGTAGVASTHKSSSSDAALKGIEVMEQNDKPFKLTLHYGWLPTHDHGDVRAATGVLDVPNSQKGTASTKTAKFDGDRMFVRGVQACTNGSGTRLKGVKVFSARVNDDGSIEKGNPEASFERPNCSEWGKIRSCGDGKVAVGVTAHHGDKGFSGLALQCKSIHKVNITDVTRGEATQIAAPAPQ